ncbi:site-specific DNA-methyltransferase [Rhizobium sp. Root1220]|uniref:site-specific DNA-methyltransferase n=1 Tax=Rhizobium sp. Root1220 TaxID=1736432 RepID=UPI000A74F615|nr:site-specific DNA-methyltransferase [Rhizobium sp. Root1220]
MLDPFAGAGTVGAVCNRLDPKSVLVERVPEYVDTIRRRLGGSKPILRSVSDIVALAPGLDDMHTPSDLSACATGVDSERMAV